jgi:PAS domain S-box-containing protein
VNELWRRAPLDQAEPSAWQTPLAEQLSLLQDVGRMGLWERDLRTGVGRWDRHVFRLFGFEPAPTAPAYDEVTERVYPDDREALRAHHRQLAEHAGRSEIHFRLQHPDGQLRHVHLITEACCDDGGRPVRMIGVVIDDTEGVERVRAEREQALQLRERMALMADAAGLGLWTREVGTAHSEWNAQMYRIHHRAVSEGPPTLDQWLERHVHALDRERVARERHSADEQWTPTCHSEFRIPTPDGGMRWVYSWSRRELRDGRRMAFGMHIDITDRRSAEFELRSERERSEFALAAAGVGVWQRGLRGEPLYWSEGMYRLRGVESSDPRPMSEIAFGALHPDDRVAMEELVSRHVNEGVPYEYEFRVFWPDGTTRWLATRGQAVRDADGNPMYLVGVNFDITGRREADAMLREKQRLEQASRAKSDFMARMSHELRTPMNAVLGFTELLADDSQDVPTPRQRERLGRIRAAGEHLLALINDVLDLASLDADERGPACDAVVLDDFLNDALRWGATFAEQHGVQLRSAVALPGCVLADRRRLVRITSNLLSNAVKFNRPGGWVQVATLRREQGGAGRWAIVVSDSGRGMSAGQMRRMYEPFERLGAEQQGIEGTGIGLTIVRQLVDRMNGEIEVSSQPDVGTEFRVWLPEADAGAPLAARQVPSEAPSPAPRLAVLCVEDNPVNLMLVRELFALRPSMSLATAADGASGIQLALDAPPDLVLLDLQLPDMHGVDVLKRLRAEGRLRQSRIVALSANAMPADVREALEAGFDDYWTKPIDIPRFLADIDAFAAQRSTGPDARASN